MALPTSDKENFALVKQGFRWLVNDGSPFAADPEFYGHTTHHLYIISDDEIEVGDWFVIYLNDKCIKEPNLQSYILKSEGYTEDSTMVRYSDGCKTGFAKKITASTDTGLNLPAIPEWLIKEYADKQTFEVLVDYRYDGSLDLLYNTQTEVSEQSGTISLSRIKET